MLILGMNRFRGGLKQCLALRKIKQHVIDKRCELACQYTPAACEIALAVCVVARPHQNSKDWDRTRFLYVGGRPLVL